MVEFPGKTQASSKGNTDETANESTKGSATQELEEAFFHVSGMHSATCETFLEQRALATDGVTAANASYVTESIQVTYDQMVCDEEAITSALAVVGYRVLSREETSGESTATVLAGETPETRVLEDLLGYRYIAGVLFGTFLLLPYVIVLYPQQVLELLGYPSELFAGGFIAGGGILLAPLFLLTTGVVVFFTGLPVLRGAYVSLATREMTSDLLVTVTILAVFVYSTLALGAGRIDLYFDLAIVISASVVAAIFYESLVKRRAMDALTELTVSQTESARVCLPSGTLGVAVSDLLPGDRILVKQGERVPVDGTLAEGVCTVDESIITGESLPVEKKAGDELVGGSVVTADAAIVEVGDPPTSSIDRLTTAVWQLQSATHGLQRRTDRLAGVLLPVVGLLAVFVGLWQVSTGGGVLAGIFGALGVVLVTAPWVLGLSTPLSVATNLQAALSRGIVVFDETVFERLIETDTVVFDKTGTLTTGEMQVVETDLSEELLLAAATIERRASHPAGAAIVEAVRSQSAGAIQEDGGGTTDGPPESFDALAPAVREFKTHPRGVSGKIDGELYLVGHPSLFIDHGWEVSSSVQQQAQEARDTGRLPVVVGRAGSADGVIILGDESRPEWNPVFSALGEAGISVVILTGDDERAARRFGAHDAVDEVFADISPEGKIETIEELQADGHVTMVGDGTNDAPALATADLGIALGSGTALASDAADIALVNDDLSAVRETFVLSRAATRRVRQNTGLSLSYNVAVIPFALGGLLGPPVTMGAAVLACGLVALNAHRPLLE